MKVKIKETERIDDLEYKGLKIIQEKEGFCFGIDSVLLANFAKEIKAGSKVIDLGTGTGIIPTLLCAKTNLSEIAGVEVQEEVAEMAERSIIMNELQDKFKIIYKNVKDLGEILSSQSFDVVVTNPPYKKSGTGIKNTNLKKEISRHEILATLEDFIQKANYLLKDKGEFYLVHRPERLVDILSIMRKYKIEPKILQMVCPNADKAANLVLIKGIKNANEFLLVKPNLYVYNENGEYTEEILKIYNKI